MQGVHRLMNKSMLSDQRKRSGAKSGSRSRASVSNENLLGQKSIFYQSGSQSGLGSSSKLGKSKTADYA